MEIYAFIIGALIGFFIGRRSTYVSTPENLTPRKEWFGERNR